MFPSFTSPLCPINVVADWVLEAWKDILSEKTISHMLRPSVEQQLTNNHLENHNQQHVWGFNRSDTVVHAHALFWKPSQRLILGSCYYIQSQKADLQ